MNRIIHGDCLEVIPTLDKVDMILADLPYGKTQNKWDSVIDLDMLWACYNELRKDKSAIVLFGQDKFTAKVMLSNEKEHRYNLVWDKNRPTGFLNVNRMPLRSHEDIMIFYKKLPVYNPQMFKGKPNHSRGNVRSAKNNCYGDFDVTHQGNNKNGDMKYPRSVIKYNRVNIPSHPSQKPVELFEYLIKTYTNEGEIVLDNTAGSMTTAIACINTNRKYICIEKDKEYYEKGLERVENYKPQLKMAI